jgi:hypothetical protein
MEADEKKAPALERQGITNYFNGNNATNTGVGQGSGESTVTICDLVTKPDTCREVAVQEVIQNITTGVFRDIVTEVRNAYAHGGKDAARPIKESLPVICFSAILSHRSKEGVIRRTGLICADIDSLSSEQMDELRPRIWGDSHVYASFASPTNSGFKVVFRYDQTHSHEAAFAATRTYVRQAWDCAIDEACKDVPRSCYYSWDPQALFNPAAVPLDVGVAEQMQAARTPYTLPPKATFGRRTADEVREVLKHIPPHPEYKPWLDIASGVWAELGEVEGTAVLKEWSPPEDADGRDYEKKYPGRLQQKGFGTVVMYAKEHGFRGYSATSTTTGDVKADATATTTDDPVAVAPLASSSSQVQGKDAEEEKRVAEFRARLAKRLFDQASPPPEPVTRFFIIGKGVSTPGNLTTVIAQAKAGKTGFISAMIAAAIVADRNVAGRDTLGITAAPPNGAMLLHIDTEQSLYDHHSLIKQVLRRAGVEELPTWLRSYGLAGFDAADLQRSVGMLLGEQLKGQGSVYAVIIDGGADLVRNVNDQLECDPFVAKLQSWAIEYDCPFVLVVHENPNQQSGKMRGHLGSQLERKAESNLRLTKSGGVTTVFSPDKMRGAPITKAEGPCFRWDDAEGMHVSCGTKAENNAKALRAEHRDLAEQVFRELSKPAATWSELKHAVAKVREIKLGSAEDWIKKLEKSDAIVAAETGGWKLNPATP